MDAYFLIAINLFLFVLLVYFLIIAKLRGNRKMSKLERVALRNAGHIKQPYTLDEILDKIESDDYSSDLLMQHLLLYIAKRENNA